MKKVFSEEQMQKITSDLEKIDERLERSGVSIADVVADNVFTAEQLAFVVFKARVTTIDLDISYSLPH